MLGRFHMVNMMVLSILPQTNFLEENQHAL